MTRHRGMAGATSSFTNHIDPEKDEHLKWTKRETENKVKRILKLSKTEDKDGNSKKKSELIQLIEDFHQQYESLYSWYEDLRAEVKKSVDQEEDNDSSSTSASDYYSPRISIDATSATDSDCNMEKPESSDLEDMTILKDILTSSSEVKNIINFDSHQVECKLNEAIPIQEKVPSLEVLQAHAENEKLRAKVSELQIIISAREKELSNEKMKFSGLTEKLENLKERLEATQQERNCLYVELKELEKENTKLNDEIVDQRKALLEQETMKSRLTDYKSGMQVLENGIDEMAAHIQEEFEDKCEILSQRITAAKQLHLETRENFKGRSRTTDEIGSNNVNELALAANDLLMKLDSLALNLESCTNNFHNRISKASCELKLAKDWAMRMNKALPHMNDDLKCLLKQVDDKEAEIIGLTEKVLKWENKARESEKMMKENEEVMVGLQEEKREAIRQLCVWIDYQRGRADSYKKMVSEINAGRLRKTS